MKRDEFEVSLGNKTLYVIASYDIIKPEYDMDCYHVEVNVQNSYDTEEDEEIHLDEDETEEVEYQIAKQVMRQRG